MLVAYITRLCIGAHLFHRDLLQIAPLACTLEFMYKLGVRACARAPATITREEFVLYLLRLICSPDPERRPALLLSSLFSKKGKGSLLPCVITANSELRIVAVWCVCYCRRARTRHPQEIRREFLASRTRQIKKKKK